MNQIINNVEKLLDTYGSKINTDKKLILLYWQIYDLVEMDKNSISTVDFLNKSTNMEEDIINASHLLKSMEVYK